MTYNLVILASHLQGRSPEKKIVFLKKVDIENLTHNLVPLASHLQGRSPEKKLIF